MVGWLLAAWLACSPCGDGEMCAVEGGRYLVRTPTTGSGPHPVLMYFHGYGRSPEDVQDRKTVQPWREAGYLTVFPEGANGSWSNVGSPHTERDELAFFEAVWQDVQERFDVESSTVVSGHSHGSSMAWDIACYRPESVLALAGSAGTFWVPEPVECVAPVPVRHSHGLADRIMPMEGRPIGSAQQGDVYEGVGAWALTNGCTPKPRAPAAGGCQVWSCTRADLRLCLHDGGHGAPAGWAGDMLEWVDTVR